ncbi:hypothetical protein EC957_004542 [Mortierella hygrophila]|uniref:Uncharacterized protein n=1 Tax=Mortierella hygrophila TaxID=979708 RepID=A0A9P6K792_9FUNG|nr:hypothetical protein EC957_004542 [Mortierella hygrophila]
MSSSPSQGISPPSSPSSESSERLKMAIEGQHVHSQVEHTESLGRASSKRKGLSNLFKEDPKVKKTVPISAASSAPMTLVGTEGRIQSAVPDRNAVPVSLKLLSPADLVEMSSAKFRVTASQLKPNPAAGGSLRVNIFPENVPKPIYKTDLPKPHTSVDKTLQLVYCCSPLSKAPRPLQPTSDSDVTQDSPSTTRRRNVFSSLIMSCRTDIDDLSILFGPVLDRNTYCNLLSCFISKFEQTIPLDLTLLHGLVQLVECTSSRYLIDDDLVRIANVLSKELLITHIGTNDHPCT